MVLLLSDRDQSLFTILMEEFGKACREGNYGMCEHIHRFGMTLPYRSYEVKSLYDPRIG